ncbi:hypothetical protein RLL94_00520, partial [Streptococcus pneumoniae]|nr:hypothetical protein [Streptococcus pneumoniae]
MFIRLFLGFPDWQENKQLAVQAAKKLLITVFSEAYCSLSMGRESSLLVTAFLRGLSNPLVPQE